MSRIILVEDHERLAELVEKKLSASGIAVDTFDRIESAWVAIRDLNYQAMVLDRGLPDGDGVVLLKRMRQAGLGIPCLILTAQDALHDRIEGLEAGADDYLAKPFAMDEMLARVRALLRRSVASVDLDPNYGDLIIKPNAGTLHCGDKSVSLSPSELQIIWILVRKEGEVVRHSALEAAGWGLNDAVTPNALDVVIHRLRRKLIEVGSHLQIINMRTHGYALSNEKVAK